MHDENDWKYAVNENKLSEEKVDVVYTVKFIRCNGW